jgi:hypothetical protein
MQLKLSLLTITLLSTLSLQAEDSVKVQYLNYNEDSGETTISAPSISITKDIGTDYTINASIMTDVVSGASDTYYNSNPSSTSSPVLPSSNIAASGATTFVTDTTVTDTSSAEAVSGASAFSRGTTAVNDIAYDGVEYEEQRLATSLSLTTRFDNRDELSTGLNYSQEADFYSYEVSAEYMHWLNNNKNQYVSLGGSFQRNRVLIHCDDYGSCDASSGASQEDFNNVVNLQTSFFQNIDSSSYFKLSLFYANENGYLSNPYMNVVRYNDGISAFIVNDSRPTLKIAYGTNIKYAKSFDNDLTIHLNYRYYQDDWELSSNTLSTSLFYQATDKLLLSTSYRYYQQSKVFFYNCASDYFTNEEYATSDERLSDFDANTYQAAIKYDIFDDLSIDLSYSYYEQSTGTIASSIITGVTYKY